MKRQKIVIEQDRDGISYCEGELLHSVADRDGISLAPYIHALYGVVRQARPRHVLMIGCGGGTLATMLTRAGVAVTLVDNDPQSFRLARSYFHLPDAVTCEVGDGAAFLRQTPDRYDAIVLDAYAKGRVPRHLVTAAFFALVKSRLARGGLLAMNVMVKDDDDRAPDRIVYRLKEIFRQVRLLDEEGEPDRNALVMAGPVRGIKRPRLLLRPRKGGRTVAAGLKALEFRPPRP
jgi:predicted membrane-bound spermidine synthase